MKVQCFGLKGVGPWKSHIDNPNFSASLIEKLGRACILVHLLFYQGTSWVTQWKAAGKWADPLKSITRMSSCRLQGGTVSLIPQAYTVESRSTPTISPLLHPTHRPTFFYSPA